VILKKLTPKRVDPIDVANAAPGLAHEIAFQIDGNPDRRFYIRLLVTRKSFNVPIEAQGPAMPRGRRCRPLDGALTVRLAANPFALASFTDFCVDSPSGPLVKGKRPAERNKVR
jgi:hypothetical protein